MKNEETRGRAPPSERESLAPSSRARRPRHHSAAPNEELDFEAIMRLQPAKKTSRKKSARATSLPRETPACPDTTGQEEAPIVEAPRPRRAPQVPAPGPYRRRAVSLGPDDPPWRSPSVGSPSPPRRRSPSPSPDRHLSTDELSQQRAIISGRERQRAAAKRAERSLSPVRGKVVRDLADRSSVAVEKAAGKLRRVASKVSPLSPLSPFAPLPIRRPSRLSVAETPSSSLPSAANPGSSAAGPSESTETSPPVDVWERFFQEERVREEEETERKKTAVAEKKERERKKKENPSLAKALAHSIHRRMSAISSDSDSSFGCRDGMRRPDSDSYYYEPGAYSDEEEMADAIDTELPSVNPDNVSEHSFDTGNTIWDGSEVPPEEHKPAPTIKQYFKYAKEHREDEPPKKKK
ncbi:hypothetical protein K490DRAFT_61698 [Saccharata proteae CBS 121410]|uniref:Uncharacterized protein n=1 Tax=Saccharata proteae CBS 121410 TaxID=1314787 RepID=A0A9P4I3C7_9PEZI|nr:hypothetical protein K490DRAFT_61698 [Saccharata proteae CBS 121410]